MSSRYIAPFDFMKLKNYFIGNDILFVFVLVLLISYAAGHFNMSNKIFYAILLISVILFGAFTGESIYILALILLAAWAFKAIANSIR